MAKRAGNTLAKWEVALVKAMLARKYVPQDIQAYFSRPTRSINHARISEIRDETKHKSIKPASEAELDSFLVLLCHKFLRRDGAAIGALQHGHRGRLLTSAPISRRRMVAIEFGM